MAQKSGTTAIPLDLFGTQGHQLIAEWLNSNQIAFRSAIALTEQWVAFSRGRLDEDIAALKALAACKDFKDVANCQRTFAERAFAQYAEQFTEMGQQLTGVLGGCDVDPLTAAFVQ